MRWVTKRGTLCSCLEHFLLKRKLMGPCWLDISNVTVSSAPVTWCKWEVSIDTPKDIAKTEQAVAMPVPPLRAAAVSIKTVVNPASHKHEIVAVSVLTHDQVSVEGDTLRPESKVRGCTEFVEFTGV